MKFTDKEFFDYEVANGMTQDCIAYRDMHYKVGLKIMQDLNPRTFMEIGCGTGALLEYMATRTLAIGLDTNRYSKRYFNQRNPELSSCFINIGIEELGIYPKNRFDVIVSIECFEHLEDKVLAHAINFVANNCKHFIFSSTPHPDPNFDEQWGHINVKPTEEWIRLFEEAGLKFKSKFGTPTTWTLLFEKL